MGSTITEKILSRCAGQPVSPGDIVWVTPDLIVGHDLNYPIYRRMLHSIGIERVESPEKLVLTIDHQPYTDSAKVAADFRLMREDARNHGIGHFFDVGRAGISHNLPLDRGLIRPGMLVITSDTRSPALGCVGALGIAFGGAFLMQLATGRSWVRVPATIRVSITGKRPSWLMSRDIAQWIAGQIGLERADYHVLEFDGPVVDGMDIDERHTLCNTMVDLGVKSAIAVPSEAILATVRSRTDVPFEVVRSDPDAHYADHLIFDIADLEPQVAVPPSPELARPVSELAGKPVTHAFVGACIAGKLEDMRAAAQVLRGRKVADGVQFCIIPATQEVYHQSLGEGLIDIFAAAGVQIAVGTCGPCVGGIMPLNDGDVCISTGTRNDPGRMGSPSSEVYLASAATVAASAVTGRITDPRTLAS
ncbi:aconitase/3-isopropylmalate dehydratase large subunit family protein [Stella sp.]|uniref:3-isopropylmalate dehydratase large subunit n=1 Tax=Stella sp. TaxID=2912054 RepID=UPI0035AE0E31